jgi:transposase InsO family protein
LTDGDIVMTLLESLPTSYEYLITALETRAMKDLNLEYVTARLMHEVSKRKENETKEGGAALLARNGNGETSQPRKETRTCYNCGLVGHLARNCRKTKKESANKATMVEAEDEFAFAASDGFDDRNIFKWIIDSGATQHMTPHRQAFLTYQPISNRKVFLGDNGMVEAIGMGCIIVEVMVNAVMRKIRIQDALHVPKLHANLLSVSKLVAQGLKVEFNNQGCVLATRSGEMIVTVPKLGNLYQLEFKTVNDSSTASVAQAALVQDSMELWHKRLGHLNVKSVKALEGMVGGMQVKKATCDLACEACIEGKQARKPFPNDGATRATKVLEIVHSDVCGPMKTTSMGGARYFLTFIDDFSRKVWVLVLKCKSEVFERFKAWKALVENESGHKVKVLRSDNGGEYTSKAFEAFMRDHGIAHQTSAPYTPQQNGVAERANRTLVEMARAMLHAQGLKYEFWAEAVSNAAYIRNRCPTSAVASMTPQEAWSGRRPNIGHMRIFGCVVYALDLSPHRSKLDAKGTKCLFLGYWEGSKAYRLMCLETKKILKSRDVTFMEDKKVDGEPLEMGPSGSNGGFEVDQSPIGQDVTKEEEEETLTAPTPKKKVVVAPPEDGGVGEAAKESRYPTRERRPLGEWWMNHILPQDQVERANVAFLRDPSTVEEAMRSANASKWELAMQAEYASLMSKGTWELAPLPTGRKSVGCKWVFCTKRDALGSVVRYKARLVAKGYSQVEGVDFNETFAPVAKFCTIRCMGAIGAAMDLEMHQMDVITAFLNPLLEEVIFMDQPKGFVVEGREQLKCKLKKAIYGLRQSGRAWYMDVDALFAREGYKRSHADHSLYIKQTSASLVIVIVYVDDLIIMTNTMTIMEEVKAMLKREYDMSDLGELHYCLGVEFQRQRTARTISMSQSKYIKEVLKRFNMEECKAIGTPLDVNSKLEKLTDEQYETVKVEMEDVPYKAAVGSLMYAMVATRADLAFPMSVVSQHMAKSGPKHWTAIKRIMRYLQGTLEAKLVLGGKSLALVGFCDADWAGDVTDRRSTSGYVFMLGDGAISWNSKKQPTIALSTTEAEYMAISQSTREALWLRQLLSDVGLEQERSTPLMCDNQGAIALVKNPTHHSRSKHIDIQHHFIREKVESNVIEMRYIPTERMVADVLTKALAKPRHEALRQKMGLMLFGNKQSGSVEISE